VEEEAGHRGAGAGTVPNMWEKWRIRSIAAHRWRAVEHPMRASARRSTCVMVRTVRISVTIRVSVSHCELEATWPELPLALDGNALINGLPSSPLALFGLLSASAHERHDLGAVEHPTADQPRRQEAHHA
jgi:hypothetical protein